jgi:hypothetical protein
LRPFEVLARTSLALGTLAGFSLGLLLLLPLAFRVPLEIPWLTLAQVHGQVQTLGFATLFIFAVGSILFPRFLSVPAWNAALAERGGIGLAAGVVLRALSQPLDPSPLRGALLIASGLLALLGPLLFAAALVGSCRQSVQPRAVWQIVLGTALVSLLISLLLNLAATVRLAVVPMAVVSAALDEAIVSLQIRGFIVGVGLAVGLKLFTSFLILRPPRLALLPASIASYAFGLVLNAVGWLLHEVAPEQPLLGLSARAAGDLLTLIGVVGYLVGVRLFEPAARESGRPHVTNPVRTWIRLAFGWLLVASVLQVALSLREMFGGPAASFTELSATRHAITMGYLLVLLFAMAARILPGYSGWALQHPRFIGSTVYLLLAGALLRVLSELLGGYSGPYGPLTGLGGLLGTLGFLLFAASLWPALGNLPRPAGQGSASDRG